MVSLVLRQVWYNRLMRRLAGLTAGILVATSTRYRTTSTVVTGPDGACLVIDPALTVPELRLLAADLTGAGLRPAAGFATHPHWDHLLWCAELGDPPRWAAQAAVTAAVRRRDRLLGELRAEAPGHDLDRFARLSPLPPRQRAIPWPGPEAIAVTHDAHAAGHTAVFLPATGTLVAGDMLSDSEIPLLDTGHPDPLGSYRAGLALLAALPVRLLVPGHGSPCDAAGFRRRLAADTAYLDALERGEDVPDPRLTEDWLRDHHREQLPVRDSRRGRPRLR